MIHDVTARQANKADNFIALDKSGITYFRQPGVMLNGFDLISDFTAPYREMRILSLLSKSFKRGWFIQAKLKK